MQFNSVTVRESLKIAFTYFIVSAIWIFFSDRLLGTFTSDPALLLEMETYKGWFFVLITSVLLFLLIKKSTRKLVISRNQMEKALNEKQVVLSELHHRVKNNLSIICGLIDLQADELENREEIRALKSVQYRIYSLAEIEELFYQNREMSRIPFHQFLNHLVESLNEPDGKQFRIVKDIEELYLNIDMAVPFGLMANEIISLLRINGHLNQVNEISIRLSIIDSNRVKFEISFDDIPSSVLSRLRDKDQIESILMNLFLNQLDASAEWQQDNRITKLTVVFEPSGAVNNTYLAEDPLANHISD